MEERNQRLDPRVRTALPARLETGKASLEGRIENIGRGGAFFATDTLEEPIEVGMEVVLRFRPEGSPADRTLLGTVLRLERYFHEGGLYRALAIRFFEPYEA